MTNTSPFFYDVTLRDGNQALKRPWDHAEKAEVFNRLLNLGVQGIEVGFPVADETDFKSCQALAQMAPDNVVIGVLARANPHDIKRAVDAVRFAKRPRIHTFIAMNPRGLKYVLKKDLDQVTAMAVDSVQYAKSLLPSADIEFSVEHFGDCQQNLSAVIGAIDQIIKAGATVINLANTVERCCPSQFIAMVRQVREQIGDRATLSVHCHNDLGMATATTVESYFAGAHQLETALNGLGERAGNANMYEVAIALHNSGIQVPLKTNLFYETSQVIAALSDIDIFEKSPIVGSDVLAHRSGIHQDATHKTKSLEVGQYVAFPPKLVGRDRGEKIRFTNQSGKSALLALYQKIGYPITLPEAEILLPYAKRLATTAGELTTPQLKNLYFDRLCHAEGPYICQAFERLEHGQCALSFSCGTNQYQTIGHGSGPIECCIDALRTVGISISVEKYEQRALNPEEKESGEAIATMVLKDDIHSTLARGIDRSTTQANINAIFNGLNQLYHLKG